MSDIGNLIQNLFDKEITIGTALLGLVVYFVLNWLWLKAKKRENIEEHREKTLIDINRDMFFDSYSKMSNSEKYDFHGLSEYETYKDSDGEIPDMNYAELSEQENVDAVLAWTHKQIIKDVVEILNIRDAIQTGSKFHITEVNEMGETIFVCRKLDIDDLQRFVDIKSIIWRAKLRSYIATLDTAITEDISKRIFEEVGDFVSNQFERAANEQYVQRTES